MPKGSAIATALLGLKLCMTVGAQSLPIADGRYIFTVRFAEHPHMTGGSLDAEIRRGHIKLTSQSKASVFPAGVVAEGALVWHPASKQWIVAEDESDKNATDVGGCSDGPFVVDLEENIFWTCWPSHGCEGVVFDSASNNTITPTTTPARLRSTIRA